MYTYITNRDSPNFTPSTRSTSVFGMARVIEGITIHHWGDPRQNPQFNGIVDYLCRYGGNTSAHFVATGTNRQVACIISPSDVAWHSGSAWGNARTIGIELDPRARDIDYDVAAELIADIRSAYGDVPIYWHSYFTATACPGAWNAERLDQLSYTKYSHATDWGKGGDKVVTAPTPTPTPTPDPLPPVVEPAKPKSLWKLSVDGKQVAAYSTEMNAYSGYVYYGKKGIITLDGKDITAEIVARYTTPSPTADPPAEGGGKPVTEKPDYGEENNNLLKQILAIVQTILEKITGVFK